jgi:hypothetical protein
MERPHVLASLNGKILVAYSRGTIDALRETFPLRVVLPHLEPVFAANVDKEVRKDVLIIRRAAEAAATGVPIALDAVREVMEATKLIDREFLARARALPVRVIVPYEQITPIRTQRIECLMQGAAPIFAAWHRGVRLRQALRAVYAQDDFEQLLYRVLHLYAVETHALSRAVRLPALLTPLRERAGDSVLRTMDGVARRLASQLARRVYRERVRAAVKPLQ